MVAAAPHLHPTLVAAIERLDRRDRSIADVHRRVGEIAELIGHTRPSYEQVRVFVHAHRERRIGPSAREILLDIAFSQTPLQTYTRLLDM